MFIPESFRCVCRRCCVPLRWLSHSPWMDGCLTGKGYDQSQTTIDVNAPRSGKLVTTDNLKGPGLFLELREVIYQRVFYILLNTRCYMRWMYKWYIVVVQQWHWNAKGQSLLSICLTLHNLCGFPEQLKRLTQKVVFCFVFYQYSTNEKRRS